MAKKRSAGSTQQPVFPGEQSAPEAPKWTGSFRPGGAFYPDGPGTDALTKGVLEALVLRRTSTKSPAQMAVVIQATLNAAPAFPETVLEQWKTLERFEDWWQARVGGSASAFVKYEGCPHGTWAGGRHVPREKVNWESIPDHVREEMNRELVEAIERLAGHTPPPIGEVFVESGPREQYVVGMDPADEEADESLVPLEGEA